MCWFVNRKRNCLLVVSTYISAFKGLSFIKKLFKTILITWNNKLLKKMEEWKTNWWHCSYPKHWSAAATAATIRCLGSKLEQLVLRKPSSFEALSGTCGRSCISWGSLAWWRRQRSRAGTQMVSCASWGLELLVLPVIVIVRPDENGCAIPFILVANSHRLHSASLPPPKKELSRHKT